MPRLGRHIQGKCMLSFLYQFENPSDESFMVSYRPVFFDRKSEIEFNEKVTLFWIKYPRYLGFLWLWSRNNLILRLFYRKMKWNNKKLSEWNIRSLIWFCSYLEFQQPSIFLHRPEREYFCIGSIELKIHQTGQSDNLLKLRVRPSQEIFRSKLSGPK